MAALLHYNGEAVAEGDENGQMRSSAKGERQ
jgi:hypothetical protein